MKLRTLIAAGLVSGAGLFAAHAQDTVVITPEQDVLIREYVATQPVVTVEKPSNFELIVGAIVPDVFKPGALAENTIPDRQYQYVVIDGRTALVDPATRKIVHIVQ